MTDTPNTQGATAVSEWQLIETAPKDGSEFLAYIPGGVSEGHIYSFPRGHLFKVLPCRWKVPDGQSRCGPGWFTPIYDLGFGVWDDPSTDIDPIEVNPTHWRPLPAPPVMP